MVHTCNAQGDSLTKKLEEVQLTIIANNGCKTWYQDVGIKRNITSELMCAGYWKGCKVGTSFLG